MAVVLTLNDKLAAIVKEVEKLSPEQQHLLLLNLKKDDLKSLYREMQKGVRPGKKPTDDELAEMVRNNRKKWKKK